VCEREREGERHKKISVILYRGLKTFL